MTPPTDHTANPHQQSNHSGEDDPAPGLTPGPNDLPHAPLDVPGPDLPGSHTPEKDVPEIQPPAPIENPPFDDEDPAEDIVPLDHPVGPLELPDITPVPNYRDQPGMRS